NVEDFGTNGVLISRMPAHVRRFSVHKQSDQIVVGHNGMRWCYRMVSELEALARTAVGKAKGDASTRLFAKMPGVITEIRCAEGDSVKPGDILVVMEAMKLIVYLEAGCAGQVKSILCAAGEVVPNGKLLLELDPAQG